jgi:hypothetical protein
MDVIVNPITDQVTHVVVKEDRQPRAERLVPVSMVVATDSEQIRLSCRLSELRQLTPFARTEFIRVQAPRLDLRSLCYYVPAWRPQMRPEEPAPMPAS